MNVDDRVVVISECGTTGCIGTVVDLYQVGHQRYAQVSLEGTGWVRSYNVNSLMLYNDMMGRERKEPKMTKFTTVGVRLNTDYKNKVYYFRAYEQYDLNDNVVVETTNGYVAGVVCYVNVEGGRYPLRDVVCKIDDSALKQRKADAERLVELRRSISKRLEVVKNRIIIEEFADRDPELKAMLDELDALGGKMDV